jgi:hypothetical protein
MKRRRSEKEQKLIDDARLMRAWRAWHADQLTRRLMAQLEDLRSARELVAFITAQDWGVVDANTRLIALHEINAAITRNQSAIRCRANHRTHFG